MFGALITGKLAAAGTALAFSVGSVGAASAAGVLPAPAQTAISTAAEHVGVHLPAGTVVAPKHQSGVELFSEDAPGSGTTGDKAKSESKSTGDAANRSAEPETAAPGTVGTPQTGDVSGHDAAEHTTDTEVEHARTGKKPEGNAGPGTSAPAVPSPGKGKDAKAPTPGTTPTTVKAPDSGNGKGGDNKGGNKAPTPSTTAPKPSHGGEKHSGDHA